MTLYAGEQFRITATGTEFNGDALVPANVTAATVKIYDSTPALIVTATLTWDAAETKWLYLWDTTGLAAGSYKYQVTFVGVDGKSSWEWKRVRFSKAAVTV